MKLLFNLAILLLFKSALLSASANEPEALRGINRYRQPADSKQTNNGFRLIMEIN